MIAGSLCRARLQHAQLAPLHAFAGARPHPNAMVRRSRQVARLGSAGGEALDRPYCGSAYAQDPASGRYSGLGGPFENALLFASPVATEISACLSHGWCTSIVSSVNAGRDTTLGRSVHSRPLTSSGALVVALPLGEVVVGSACRKWGGSSQQTLWPGLFLELHPPLCG